MNDHPFKDAKDLQILASMLAPQYSQSQIREFYLNGLLPDFIGTDMDYWMLIRSYLRGHRHVNKILALKEQRNLWRDWCRLIGYDSPYPTHAKSNR